MDYDDADYASPDLDSVPVDSVSWVLVALPIMAIVYEMWPAIVTKVGRKREKDFFVAVER